MRTTVSIPDELLESARRRARETGQTLGAVIEGALRRELASSRETTSVAVPVFTGGTGPRPGIDLTSNRALYETLDEGVPPLDRR